MRLFRSSSKQRGQVVGLWWSDLVVLNAPDDSTTGSILDNSSCQDIVTNMRRSLMELKGQYMTEDGLSVDYVGISKSDKFEDYIQSAQALRSLDVTGLSQDERKTLFINVYNSLIVHAMAQGFVKPGDNFVKRLKMYATASYNIGGLCYSLNDMENGVLRGNQRSPTPLSSVPFGDEDPRLSTVVSLDPRIHFALNCGARSCPPILVYKADKIDSQLDRACQGALRDAVVNAEERSLTVSMLFKWFQADFGGSEREVCEWIATRAPTEVQTAIESLQANEKGILELKYHPYDWGINS